MDGGLTKSGDHDRLLITDKAALIDIAFTNVRDVEILEFGEPVVKPAFLDMTGQKVTLGAFSVAAGIDTVINSFDQGLTVDATARAQGLTFIGGQGNDVLLGSQGVDNFQAGAGDDTFSVKLAALTSADTYSGGHGLDTLRILDSGTLLDGVFAKFDSVEQLALDGTKAQTVTLAGVAQAAGIALIDGSKVTGGLTATNNTYAMTVIAGTGADTIKVIDESKVLIASKSLTVADTLTGDGTADLHFTDAVKMTDKNFAGLKVSGFNELVFDNAAAGQSLAAGNTFAQLIDIGGITEIRAVTTAGFTFDFRATLRISSHP